MQTNPKDEAAVRAVVESMDRAVAAQDGEIRARLAAARQGALQRSPRRSLQGWFESLMPWKLAGAVAVMGLLAVMISIGGSPRQGSESSADTPELAVLVEDPDFYAEMEFYYWLEEQESEREL